MRDMTELRERARRIGESRDPSRRQLLLLRGFRESEYERIHNLRRALAVAHVLDHYPVSVGPDDVLVGKYSSLPLTEAESDELCEGQGYLWRLQQGLLWGPGSGGVGGHRTVDFEKLLAVGVQGLLDEVEGRAAAVSLSDPEAAAKACFYRACRTTLNALLGFADRYQKELVRLHAVEGETQREHELGALVETFARVPRHPPRSFAEALQSVWFVQFALTLADDGSCTGRPDNYLWPYYEADLRTGRLTRETALCLIEDLYLRSNEVYGEWPETIMLGGVDRDGRPVVNELTHLFLEAIEAVRLVNPNVALCYRPEHPDELLRCCLDRISQGLSHPAIYNDRIITEGLSEAGLPPQDARYYQNSTCVEITPIGCSNAQVAVTTLYPTKALEMMLNEGRQLIEDPQLVSSVGGEALERWALPVAEGGTRVDLAGLATFEMFLAAYWGVLATTMRDCVTAAIELAHRIATCGSCPLVSCFVNDCLERGKDVAAGGARYNYWGTLVAGFSTAVDSLLAIRQAVYGDRYATLADLRRALARDFEGYEDLRHYLRNRCAKYGNDNPEADLVAVQLYDFMRGELAKYRTCLGGTFHLGIFSGWGPPASDGKPQAIHVSFGRWTGATADGRRSGTPLSECIGPASGADRSGPTAMVNSVARLDHRHGIGGLSVNCRLGRSILNTSAGRRRVVEFIRTAMSRGIFELQLNVVGSATLRRAQENPDSHRTLLVRIAGYSDYFARLSRQQQDELISRTEHIEM